MVLTGSVKERTRRLSCSLLSVMSTPRTPHAGESEKQTRRKQRRARKEASSDEVLREQTKTETEQRPYLDTEGGE